MPPRNSLVALFVMGAILLLIPLIFILLVGGHACNVGVLVNSCTLPSNYRIMVPALPYLMVVGGVLIGYNMKRISDSLLPQDMDESEVN